MKVDKEVLDVCCGGKLFYFDPAAPYLLTNDVRKGKYDIEAVIRHETRRSHMVVCVL